MARLLLCFFLSALGISSRLSFVAEAAADDFLIGRCSQAPADTPPMATASSVLLQRQSKRGRIVAPTAMVQNTSSEKAEAPSSTANSTVAQSSTARSSFLDIGRLWTYGSWLVQLTPLGLMESIGFARGGIASGVAATTADARQPVRYAPSRVAGLLLELHLPAISFKSLHGSVYNSMAEFLMELRTALCGAAQISPKSVNILGIHEHFLRSSDDWRYARELANSTASREVVVRFAVMSDSSSAKTPQVVFDLLRDALGDSNSSLMTGSMRASFANSSVSFSLNTDLRLTPVEEQRRVNISALVLPIGISAAFTSLLVWLAAF